jgi:hypothetical protein
MLSIFAKCGHQVGDRGSFWRGNHQRSPQHDINPVYRADGQVFVNQHAYGIPAAHSPVFCYRESESAATSPTRARWRDCTCLPSARNWNPS